jgi:hypothetical protein
MTSSLGTRAADQVLTALREWLPSGGVLSVYLDTFPQRIAGRAHGLSLLTGCKALRGRIPESDRADFEAAVESIEHYLNTDFSPRQPGVAIFASANPAELQAVALPRAPIDKVTWGHPPDRAAAGNDRRVRARWGGASR